jgi:hypothetical protein
MKYIVVGSSEQSLSNVSGIKIARALRALQVNPEKTKRVKHDGTLLITCRNEEESDIISKELTHIGNLKVNVQPHETLNSCKGVIMSNESVTCTDEEIMEELKEYEVKSFQRMRPRQDGSQLVILTFKTLEPPPEVPIGIEWCRVRPYIPNPRRRFRCQRFGHMSRTCRNNETCANCGEVGHVHSRQEPCNLPSVCTNCNGSHPSFDRKCPIAKYERQVQFLKLTLNLSFPEARKRAAEKEGPVSYAAMAARSQLGPRSSPRNSPRQRIHLDGNRSLSMYSRDHESDSNDSNHTPFTLQSPVKGDSVNESSFEVVHSSHPSGSNNSKGSGRGAPLKPEASKPNSSPNKGRGTPVRTSSTQNSSQNQGNTRGTPVKPLASKSNTSHTNIVAKRKHENGDKARPNKQGVVAETAKKKK